MLTMCSNALNNSGPNLFGSNSRTMPSNCGNEFNELVLVSHIVSAEVGEAFLANVRASI